MLPLALPNVSAVAASPAPASRTSTGYTYAYTVVDATGRALAGAIVTSNGTRSTSDRDGHVIVSVAVSRLVAADGRPQVSVSDLAVSLDGVVEPFRIQDRRIVVDTTAPGTIGRVSVATGDARSLHDLPVAASSLDRATIARAPAVSTDELLRELPGFDAARSNSAFTNYGQLRVSLNGSGNDRGSLLIDGVPAQDGFGGQVDWQAYAPSEIVSAELLRGPGSALYGSRAIGGTLALSTFGPPAAGASPSGDFSYTLGTRELRDLSAKYGLSLSRNLSASASLDERHEAYLDIPPDEGAPIDTAAVATETTTHLRARYDAGATAISLGTIQAYDDQEEGRPNYRFGRTFGQYDAAIDAPAGPGFVHFGAYARDTAVVNVADQLPKLPGVLRYTQNVPAYENGLAAKYTSPERPLRVELVADLRDVRGESRQTGATGLPQVDAMGQQRYLGAGAQLTYRRDRFEVLGGVRADRIDQFDSSIVSGAGATATTTSPPNRQSGAISPRLAARYDLTRAIALRVSGGGGFRAPFLNELIRGYQIGSVAYAPNANLVPERSNAFGAGLDASLPHGRLAIDATRTYVSDAILFVTESATLEKRENVGATRTDGVTAVYTARVQRCIDARVFGTAQHARVLAGPRADLGKPLAFIPNALAGVGIGAKSGASALDVDVAYAGPAAADDLAAEPLGTAVLTSIRLSTTIGGAVVSVFGDNVTDARYLSSIDRYGPPSTIGIRVGLPFGRRSDTAIDPCAPSAGTSAP